MKQRGPWREQISKVSPLWDWRIRHVREVLAQHRCPLPPEYEWFNRSFDGMDIRFLDPIRRHRPPDYQRILEWFPLVDLEVFRAPLQR